MARNPGVKKFEVAVRDLEQEEGGDEVDRFPIKFELGEDEFELKVPNEVQIGLVMGALDDEPAVTMGALFGFFRGLMEDSAYKKFRNILRNGGVEFEGVFEIFGYVTEEASGLPLEQSETSTPSRSSSGTRSTGRSPGKGSTRSS